MVRMALAAIVVLFVAAGAGASPLPVRNGLIVFTTEGARDRGGSTQLATVLPDGQGRHLLTSDGLHKVTPAWSPNGLELAVGRALIPHCRRCDVAIALLDLPSNRESELPPSGQLADPAWAPDGRTIAFDTADAGVPAYRIIAVHRDGSGLRVLGEGVHPTWSPDGSKIAFFRLPQGLYVMDADGSHAHPLGVRGANPVWSPDGARIAYEDRGSLWLARPDGTMLGRIPGTRQGFDPAWSPDGNWIVFERGYHLWVVHPGGSASHRVTSGGGIDRAPSWQPVFD